MLKTEVIPSYAQKMNHYRRCIISVLLVVAVLNMCCMRFSNHSVKRIDWVICSNNLKLFYINLKKKHLHVYRKLKHGRSRECGLWAWKREWVVAAGKILDP